MRTKGTVPATPLSAELRTILLQGPWAVGKTYLTMPRYDELKALWAVHGEALTASLPRRQKPWFVGYDWFVKEIRGENAPIRPRPFRQS